MKEQIRIQLKYGSARVNKNCSQETIDMLNKLSEIAYKNECCKSPFILTSPDNRSYCQNCLKEI
jgi:hypothetical protein